MIDPINPTFRLGHDYPGLQDLGDWLEATSPFEFRSATLSFGLKPDTGEEAVAASLRRTSTDSGRTMWTSSPDGLSMLGKIFDSVRVSSERARFIRELTDRGRPVKCNRTGKIIVHEPRYTMTTLFLVGIGKPGQKRKYSGMVRFRHSWQGSMPSGS